MGRMKNLANVRALLFDFDGLMVDTESVEFAGWQALYAAEGVALTHEIWRHAVGYAEHFDPKLELEQRAGRQLDWEALMQVKRKVCAQHYEVMEPLPGVREMVEAAATAGWGIACVSNSSRDWVEKGLSRIELRHHFQFLVTRGEAPATKPDPAPYRRALELLGISAEEAVVFEDSEPGVRSATGAGIYTVAVPNVITELQDLSMADLRVGSMLEWLDALRATGNGSLCKALSDWVASASAVAVGNGMGG